MEQLFGFSGSSLLEENGFNPFRTALQKFEHGFGPEHDISGDLPRVDPFGRHASSFSGFWCTSGTTCRNATVSAVSWLVSASQSGSNAKNSGKAAALPGCGGKDSKDHNPVRISDLHKLAAREMGIPKSSNFLIKNVSFLPL
jgi:hypothetical protein